MNIYEIRIDEDFVVNKTLIDNFLFDCQCALFFVDITNINSFELIKQLINKIEMSKYPYLQIILVFNKLDLENSRQIDNFEIKEFLEKNKFIDNIEISIRYGNNIKNLIQKINHAINEQENKLPINLISEMRRSSQSGSRIINIYLFGDSCVGKTLFLSAYFDNNLEAPLRTIGFYCRKIFIKICNNNYHLRVFDTAGPERFRVLTEHQIKQADGILLLFDLTNEYFFNDLKGWIDKIKNNSDSGKLIFYLIGNKLDESNRVISREEAEEISKLYNIKYFEVSCKLNLNIREIMARLILEYHYIDNPPNGKYLIDKKLSKFYDY